MCAEWLVIQRAVIWPRVIVAILREYSTADWLYLVVKSKTFGLAIVVMMVESVASAHRGAAAAAEDDVALMVVECVDATVTLIVLHRSVKYRLLFCGHVSSV